MLCTSLAGPTFSRLWADQVILSRLYYIRLAIGGLFGPDSCLRSRHIFSPVTLPVGAGQAPMRNSHFNMSSI